MESRGRCGEIRTDMGCGDGPARKETRQPGRSPARGTRTIGMCSFDARSRPDTGAVLEEAKRGSLEGPISMGVVFVRRAMVGSVNEEGSGLKPGRS